MQMRNQRLIGFTAIALLFIMLMSVSQPLAASSIAMDPFSVPNEMVVHYLVNKNDLIELAQKVNSDNKTNTNDLMNFTLSPVSATGQIATSSNTVNNTGDNSHKLT
jgi:hypothetical protein